MTIADRKAHSQDFIIAVVVAYAPEPERFAHVLDAVRAQVSAIIVVDNAQGAGLGAVNWSERLERIDLGGNAGVAAAQNAGLRRAFGLGATHALLLDHDSVMAQGAVAALVNDWHDRTLSGSKVATVGANYRDPRWPNQSPFTRVEGWRLRRVDETQADTLVCVSYVISSGCLISREAFEAVGPMNEDLFIDYVDIEWGLRAGTKGWLCFGAFNAAMDHVMGDQPLKILGTSYPLHSPLRHYYMARNAVWLIARSSLPTGWKVGESLRLLKRFVAYAIFAPNPHRHIAAMCSGLGDGMRGRLGIRG